MTSLKDKSNKFATSAEFSILEAADLCIWDIYCTK